MEALQLIEQSVPAWALQLLRLCIWLVILTVIFAPLERLFALHPQKLFRRALLTDLAYYFLNSLVPTLLLSLPLALVAFGVHRLIPGALLAPIAAWPAWLRIFASVAVGDIGFYWGHRLSHQIPLLWRFHAIHHSAEDLDFLINTRAHPVDMVFTRLCGLVPLYVLGLAAPLRGSVSLIPVLVLLVGTVWGFFVHANVSWRFGPLEFLIATPAFHHWHHTNDGPAYLNKNFAPLLPGIDRLFGTLYLPSNQQPARYGIDEPLPRGIFRQLLEPFFKPPPATTSVQPANRTSVNSTLNSPHSASTTSS